MSLEWLYSLDELRGYSLNTKEGRQRLETLLKQPPSILETSAVTLPQTPRVLCLMAGSCIEGVAFAQLYKAHATCIDLQRRTLAVGALSRHITGEFHLVTIFGSPLPHIGIYDFDRVVGQVLQLLNQGGAFLIDQSDLVFRIIPQYRDAFVSNLKPPC